MSHFLSTTKVVLLGVISTFSMATCTEQLVLDKKNIFASSEFGDIKLHYKNNSFYVETCGKYHQVPKYFQDQELRNINVKKLKAFLKHGYIEVKRLSDNNYKLYSKVRGNGGGPIAGMIAYWTTKAVCYGTAVAATGTAVVATGGAAGAVSGAVAAAATSGATTGAGIVAGAVAGAGLTNQAAALTVAAVAVAAPAGGIVATVEAAATGMGAIFTAIPFLP